MKPVSLLAALAATVMLSVSASAADWICDKTPLLIENVRLHDSNNLSSIFIANGEIEWIGDANNAPERYDKARKIDGRGETALPGLIDSHTHFDALPAAKHLQNELDVKTEIFPITMRQTLASGVTTARAHLAALADMAAMKTLSADNCFPSPRIAISGPGLLGGAPDVNARLMRGVQGPKDAAVKINELASLGASWAALHGVTRFSDDELAAIVNATEQTGLKLMADTDSFENLEAALRLPVVSGEYINRTLADAYPDNLVDMLAARKSDFYVSPPLGYYARSHAYANADKTRLDDDLFLFVPNEISSVMRDAFHDAFEQDEYIAGAIAAFPTFQVKFDQLRAAGAKFVIGSDTGSLGQFHHDAVWREMAAWSAFGAAPDEVIAGATKTPAQMLGASSIGALTSGALGDVVLYAGDIASGEFDRAYVTAVIKGGVVYVSDSAWIGPDAMQMRDAILHAK